MDSWHAVLHQTQAGVRAYNTKRRNAATIALTASRAAIARAETAAFMITAASLPIVVAPPHAVAPSTVACVPPDDAPPLSPLSPDSAVSTILPAPMLPFDVIPHPSPGPTFDGSVSQPRLRRASFNLANLHMQIASAALTVTSDVCIRSTVVARPIVARGPPRKRTPLSVLLPVRGRRIPPPCADRPHVDDIPVVHPHATPSAAARLSAAWPITDDDFHTMVDVAFRWYPDGTGDSAASGDDTAAIDVGTPRWPDGREPVFSSTILSVGALIRPVLCPTTSVGRFRPLLVPAVLPFIVIPQRDAYGEPTANIRVFAHPTLRRMMAHGLPVDRPTVPHPLDLSKPSHARWFDYQQCLRSGEHAFPATVLARYDDRCACEFPPARIPADVARHARTVTRDALADQVAAMTLVPVVRHPVDRYPRPSLRPTDAELDAGLLPQLAQLQLADDLMDQAYDELARIRRMNRAKFANVGAMAFDTCSCCYRYVIQHKDQLGHKQTYASKIKGMHMSDVASYDRMWQLLPDVMADLLRRYNLSRGTSYDRAAFPSRLRESLWICSACLTYFRREKWKRFPPTSMQNNLLLADVPLELGRLTHYERHLVARVRSFHQLLYLPFGQTAARGLCISYPSDTLTLVDSLPSTLADSDIVIIRQAPDNASTTKPITSADLVKLETRDDLRSAPDDVPTQPVPSSTVDPPLPRKAKLPSQFRVRPNLIKSALSWLLSENELYRDLTVTDAIPVNDQLTQEARIVTSDSSSDEGTDATVDAPLSSVPYRLRNREPRPPPPAVGESVAFDVVVAVDHVSQMDPVPMLEPKPMRDRLLHIGDVQNAARHPIMQICRASGKPVRINYQRASEALAYPGIFPTGDNHFGTMRCPITPLQYFRSRLMAYRQRCIRDPTYLFFAMNAVDWQQLESAVGIHFQMRTGIHRTALGRDAIRHIPLTQSGFHDPSYRPAALTKMQLEQHASANKSDTFVDETCMTFMQGMRGTLAYWNKVKRDLFSMLRLLGPPTWFVTFSADEFGWLECLMTAGNISREQAEQLTKQQKQELIANNPDLVSQYFDYRWSKFFALVLTEKAGSPLGRVTDHFWRIEFQRRGSPHVHMLLWIKDAPRADHENDKPAVAAFIAQHVSTEIPDEPGELRDLVLRLQQHSHTPTCTRTKKGSVKTCRFHFPRPVCERTRMVTSDDRGLPKRTLYVTRRRITDVHTNAYNPELLLAWRGNMDVQYINSLQGVVAYVSAYMTKDEPEGFRATIQSAIARLPSSANKRVKMMRMGAAILSKRELPAQEACYRLLGLQLRDASRTFVTLNTRPEEQRTRVLKPRWRDETDESTDLFQMGVTQRYILRPRGLFSARPVDASVSATVSAPSASTPAPVPVSLSWEDMTLVDFASHYLRVNTKQCPSVGLHQDETTVGDTYRLLDGTSWIRRSSKQMVVQTPGLTSEKDGQAYYYSLLLLHIPFRIEADLLRGLSPMEAFCLRSHELTFASQSLIYQSELADEVQRAVGFLHVQRQSGNLDVNIGIVDMAFRDRPSATAAAAAAAAGPSLGDRQFRDLMSFATADGMSDDQPNFLLNRDDWFASDDAVVGNMADDVMNNGVEAQLGELGESAADRLAVNPNPPMGLSAYDDLIASLNVQQRAVFNQVRDHTTRLYGRDSRVSPLKMFISGGGGTGKSHVLRAIREHILMATSSRGCVVCAPTGVAAFNVGGRTIHGLLSIPVDQFERRSPLVPPLRDDVLNEKMELFEHVDYLIIDEISMVSQNLLCKINSRLNQIKGKGKPPPDMTFGGISVIVVGDLYQLKPVLDDYIFHQCIHLWRPFVLNEMTVNERQSNDPGWCALLERIRTGDTDKASTDVRLLRNRLTVVGCTGNIIRHPIDDTVGEWRDALRIYHTNKMVTTYNDTRTVDLRTRTAVFECRAEHLVVSGEHHGLNSHQVPKHWIPTSDDDCGGLTDVIHIGVGSRVMLRRNISVSEGLVNGATGRLVSFEWSNALASPDSAGELPTGVYVLFDDPRVGVLLQSRVLTADAPQAPIRIEPRFSRFHGLGNSQRCQIQRKQLPLILCWAATVHKVQGLTLDRAIIDLNGAFTNASAYVALSRVRSLAGVALSSLATVRKIWRASPLVTKEYDRLRVLMTVLPALYAPILPSTARKKTSRPTAHSDKKKRAPRHYTVEHIVGKRFDEKGHAIYLIKWTGYDHSDNTWEPREHLRGSERLLRAFEKKIHASADAIALTPLLVNRRRQTV